MTTERSLLHCLINAAEKASNIARLCRANEELLSLLVQEKTGTEANARFEHDFKTLADVLIQETIKHDVGTLFPEMREAIKGEESPVFSNEHGEKVFIHVGETEVDTAQCLTSVLSNQPTAVAALSAEVHRNVIYDDACLGELPDMPANLDYANLGVWIDPIDATAEYIAGDNVLTRLTGIPSSGLDCVTVLIGAYECSTGVPVLGVISQPFKNKISANVYKSQLYWGVALPTLKANNCAAMKLIDTSKLRCILSTSEQPCVQRRLQDLGYDFVYSAGAGHKALNVITEEADVYVLSKGSTFKWDTCGPQAILRSCGGDIFDYRQSMDQQTPISLNYFIPTGELSIGDPEHWKCNKGGVIAVRNITIIEDLLKKLGE